MIYVDTICYESLNNDKSNMYTNHRLPILQSSNNTSMLTSMLYQKYSSEDIEVLNNIEKSILAEHVISVNMHKYVNNGKDDIAVIFYKSANEVVKYKLANLLSRFKRLHPTLLKGILRYDSFIVNLPVEDESQINHIIDTLAEEISSVGLKCKNVLEILDYMEDNLRLKSVMLEIADALNSINKYSFDMRCSLEEFVEYINNSNEYAKYFIKEIQYQVQDEDLDICIGITNVEFEVLPLFDLAGVSDNIYKEDKYKVDVPIKSILENMLVTKINTKDDFECAVNFALMMNYDDNTASTVAVIMNKLAKSLLKQDFACRGDLYKIAINNGLK